MTNPSGNRATNAELSSEKSGKSLIEIRGLVNRFGDQIVHDHLDLDVKHGEILGVVGASGSGKSVLMRSIIGLNRAYQGVIRVFGADIISCDLAIRRSIERRWGVLFQDGALFSDINVRQNVEAPMREHLTLPVDLRRELAELKLSLVGLPPLASGKKPFELSGGMRKRAGLARALALDPEILFLDEPTAGLDPIAAAQFDQLIRNLQNVLGLTVFLVTHDLDTLHATCDRIAVLAEKKMLVSGTIEELMQYSHPWVQEYFNGPRACARRATEKQKKAGNHA